MARGAARAFAALWSLLVTALHAALGAALGAAFGAALGATLGLTLRLSAAAGAADTVRGAAAANLRAPSAEIARAFEAETAARLVVTLGSTGQLYAQIRNGAPHHVVLAADAERPARLAAEGFGAPGATPKTYALGALALIGRDPSRAPDLEAVREATIIAIPNPKTAPYGAAAVAALEKAGLWTGRRFKVATAQNVAGAYAAVRSGAADLGFVARSAALAGGDAHWTAPADAHPPIRQDLLLLSAGAEIPAARRFAAFMLSDAARDVLARHGYRFDRPSKP